MERRSFFERYRPTNLSVDPLPLKVLNHSIYESEMLGHALDWSSQYLHQKSCPSYLISPLLGKILREISAADLSECYTSGNRRNEDQVDAETVENIRYQPLRLMQMVTSKVDEMCLRYKEEYEEIDTDFPQPTLQDGLAPHIFGVSYHSIKNTRRTLEDRMVVLPELEKVFNLKVQANYFAVFDGHNGVEAAAFSAAHLHHHLVSSPDFPDDISSAINYAFEATDTALLMKCKDESIRSGTTAVIALILPGLLSRGDIYCAWAGDSQAILVRNSKSMSLVSPHKPDREDEMRRIKGVGGEVISISGTWRVNGNLAVSRAIGNLDYKEYVTSTPEITHIETDGSEEFLLLASDGLFDALSPQRCVEVFTETLLSENPSDIDGVSQKLVLEAKKSGSGDNITAIVVLLKSKEDLRKLYSATKMNGIENPILETLSPTSMESKPVDILESLSDPVVEPNLDISASEPKLPVTNAKPKPVTVDTKSPSLKSKPASRTSATLNSKSPVKPTTVKSPSVSSPKTPKTTSKSPAGSTSKTTAPRTTPVKITEQPTTAKVPPAKVGISATKPLVSQKDNVTGVSKTLPPRSTTATARTQVAAKTASASTTIKKSPNETEKPAGAKTTVGPKPRPATAPSNSRLAATKPVKSEASKIGVESGKVGGTTNLTTTKSRQAPITARSTATSKETAGLKTTTTTTQRPPVSTTTARPPSRPQTSRPASSVAAKPGISQAPPKLVQPKTQSKATTVGTTQPPPPKAQPLKPGVGKVATSRKPIATTTTTAQPPSKAQNRGPIKKPLVDKKQETKTNGQNVVVAAAAVTAATVAAASSIVVAAENGETSEKVQVNGVGGGEKHEEGVVNGDVADVETLVTKPFELAENLINHVQEEDENRINSLVTESVENNVLFTEPLKVADSLLEEPKHEKIDTELPLVENLAETTEDYPPSSHHDDITANFVTNVNEGALPPAAACNDNEDVEETVMNKIDNISEVYGEHLISPSAFNNNGTSEREDHEEFPEMNFESQTSSSSPPLDAVIPETGFDQVLDKFETITTTENQDLDDIPVVEDKVHLENLEEDQYSAQELQSNCAGKDILDQLEETHNFEVPPTNTDEKRIEESDNFFTTQLESESDSVVVPTNEDTNLDLEPKVIIESDSEALMLNQDIPTEEKITNYSSSSSPAPEHEIVSQPDEKINLIEPHEDEDFVPEYEPRSEEILPNLGAPGSQLLDNINIGEIEPKIDFSLDQDNNVELACGNELHVGETVHHHLLDDDDNVEELEGKSEMNPFTADPLAEKQDSITSPTIERDSVVEETHQPQIGNPFSDQGIDMDNASTTSEEQKNPFGTEDIMFSVDDAVNVSKTNEVTFSNSFGVDNVILQNPFQQNPFESEYNFNPPVSSDHSQSQQQQHDITFGFPAATDRNAAFETFGLNDDDNEKLIITSEEHSSRNHEERNTAEEDSKYDVYAEINSNGVGNGTKQDGLVDICRVGDERDSLFGLSGNIIETKVSLENNGPDAVKGDAHKVLDLPSTEEVTHPQESFPESAYDLKF